MSLKISVNDQPSALISRSYAPLFLYLAARPQLFVIIVSSFMTSWLKHRSLSCCRQLKRRNVLENLDSIWREIMSWRKSRGAVQKGLGRPREIEDRRRASRLHWAQINRMRGSVVANEERIGGKEIIELGNDSMKTFYWKLVPKFIVNSSQKRKKTICRSPITNMS